MSFPFSTFLLFYFFKPQSPAVTAPFKRSFWQSNLHRCQLELTSFWKEVDFAKQKTEDCKTINTAVPISSIQRCAFIDFQLSDGSWFFKYSFNILFIYCENERSSFSARSLIFSTISLSSVMLTFSFNGFKKSPLAVVSSYIIPLNLL